MDKTGTRFLANKSTFEIKENNSGESFATFVLDLGTYANRMRYTMTDAVIYNETIKSEEFDYIHLRVDVKMEQIT